ncbi:MAG: hypothetical protein HeimC3_11150 [Candidatus Heimdallarchaeota archaeon LC_3]|nr:MAG: hypothetical protein HeimC3_11150 [Candidatus Heimdallarchaeota archaeon LC_3]
MNFQNMSQFSFHVLFPVLSLMFFFQSVRVFISEIYYANLATLSINITLLFLFLIFLTVLTPYIKHKNKDGVIILILALFLLILRVLINFSYPAINIRSNPTPNLMIPVLISGFTAILSLILFSKLISHKRNEITKNNLPFSLEITLIFLFVMVIDNIFTILGFSLDLSVQNTFSGSIILLLLIILFVASIILAYPVLMDFEVPESDIDPKTMNLTRKSKALLSCTLGLILFFEFALIGSPYIFLSWLGADVYIGTVIFGLMSAILLLLFSNKNLINILLNKSFLIISNIILIIFILDIGFFHLFISSDSGSSTSVLFDLGILHVIIVSLIWADAQFALLSDLFLVFSRLEVSDNLNIDWIIGGSTIPFILATLVFVFTYVYTVLPSFLEILFKGFIVPYVLIFGLILFGLSYKNLVSKEVS